MAEPSPAARALARSRVYAFLAQAFAEPDGETCAGLRRSLPDSEAALTAVAATRSRAEIAALRVELGELNEDAFAAAHRAAFGSLASGDCPPYEGEYGHAHVFQKTQCLADNAGFIRAFGLAAAPGLAERLDHISVELEFLHVLAAKEAYALAHGHDDIRLEIVREATRRYLHEHLGRWAPEFAARLDAKTKAGPFAALARLLAAFVAEDTCALGVTPAPMADVSPDAQADGEPAACQDCAAAAAAFTDAMRGEP